MTPGARVQAAIDILDVIGAGQPAEKALTNWARGARFAGSKDRAAVRDHVFAALRRWCSAAARGGAPTGRGRMIGLLRGTGTDPASLFTGQGHAPAPLDAAEALDPGMPADRLVALDCPEWLAPSLETSLEHRFEPVMKCLQERAPVFVRVNTLRGDPREAARRLAEEGIESRPSALSPTALELTANARRLRQGQSFAEGLVELQDAASQAVTDLLPVENARRILDYCAGGGGKTLAMAPRTGGALHAHDIAPARMADLPERAARAGVEVTLHDPRSIGGQGRFDLVLADAPCSGSGSWRRAPEAKWTLTESRLRALEAMQDEVLHDAAAHVASGGRLAYATCSMLRSENEDRIDTFLERNGGWTLGKQVRFDPLDGGDGFFLAILTKC
ncbi:RsmB/NOP family class I SAM-dependent RNA methyltransferase [Profundibacterium mesophilum]|uniref:Sun protein n=1 Tax=Profundibacterium mesophilum KAUST100406-0324 TaxID=1037889 RepID=A0A921NV66_9RHOB|nr:RsmB/NOP family class I SAM-dependent RNA methyltransferase [Profundibacterium mesophilum]KAF0675866.1 Sun protein [Profundibacterium mesophilum KAUST100406-0324]